MCPWMNHDQLLVASGQRAAWQAGLAGKALIFACTTVFCRRVQLYSSMYTGLPGTGSRITQNEKVSFQMLFQ